MQETRKVSFKQEEIHVSSASSEMTSATKTMQETQVQEQVEQQGKIETRFQYVLHVFALCRFRSSSGNF